MSRVFRLSFALLLAVGSVPGQQVMPLVYSAHIEDAVFHSEPGIVSFDIVNTGTKTITGFEVQLYCRDAEGLERDRGRAGQDMIELPDQPSRQTAFGRIAPQSRRRTGRSVSGCPHPPAPTVDGRVELIALVFDDGAGEGDPQFIPMTLERRRAIRQVLDRWTSRFSALTQSPDLLGDSTRLYADLVAAHHASEQNPTYLLSNEGRIQQSVWRELQGLSAELVGFAKNHKALTESPVLVSRVVELEQRARRVARGAGDAQ